MVVHCLAPLLSSSEREAYRERAPDRPPPSGVIRVAQENLDDDIVSLLERRAYDLAGCTHHTVKVYLNDKRISINNFSNYVDLFLGPKAGPTASPRVFEKVRA